MAKITTIIDIGSNSARMAIFQKTSRYGFHLIHELKSKVRISEGSYEHESYLQPQAMSRALNALKEFKKVSDSLKSRKLICVATSAIRDAPNKAEFITQVKKECGIAIKVIDGTKEAYYGALACANLLHEKSGVTIDIGGGSTELACIENGVIQTMVSLNLGSIRLKELFFDHNKMREAYDYVRKHVREHLKDIKAFCATSSSMQNLNVFGIGGSIRAYAKYEMGLESYAFNFLHGYELYVEKILGHLETITHASNRWLLENGFEEGRVDSIRPGLLILQVILEELNAKKLIISGVGVREGVFLNDMLRYHHGKIPNNINPSVRSLQDIFLTSLDDSKTISQHARTLFHLLQESYDLGDSHLQALQVASKLYNIGANFNFYQAHKHSAYIALHSLHYGFGHKERYTIATLLESSHKKRPKFISPMLANLLPEHDTLQILSFIFALSVALAKERKVTISFNNHTLSINIHALPLQQALKEIVLPRLESYPKLNFVINE